MYPPATSLPASFFFFARCLFDMSHFAIFTVNHPKKVDYGLRILTISEGLLWSKRETIGPSVFPSSPLRNSFSLIVTLTIRVDHCNFFSPQVWVLPWRSLKSDDDEAFFHMLCGQLWTGTVNLAWSAATEEWQEKGRWRLHLTTPVPFKGEFVFLEKKNPGEGSRNVGRSCVVAVFYLLHWRAVGGKLKGMKIVFCFLLAQTVGSSE